MADNDGFFGPFPLGMLPPEMAAIVQEQQDKQHMAHQDHENRVNGFVSELSNEQLGSLRLLFLHGDMQKSRTAHYWLGQIDAILRYGRKINPDTEESLEPIFGLGEETDPKSEGGPTP